MITVNRHVEAELDTFGNAHSTATLVCVGDTIFAEGQEGFLRGHGTLSAGDSLRATQCGIVQQVNKLVSIQSLQQRYTAEMGDVVIGRVIEIKSKRWKLDLQSRQEAFLLLSAVNLPGGIQRRRTVEDELNMRAVYTEGDLICAEIQSLYQDGSLALQTRSAKYGKLKDGILVSVKPNLVPRQRQHFSSIGATGVSVILGVNGLCWITQDQNDKQESGENNSTNIRQDVARVANCIRLLAQILLPITPKRIHDIFQDSQSRKLRVYDLTSDDFVAATLRREAENQAKNSDL